MAQRPLCGAGRASTPSYRSHTPETPLGNGYVRERDRCKPTHYLFVAWQRLSLSAPCVRPVIPDRTRSKALRQCSCDVSDCLLADSGGNSASTTTVSLCHGSAVVKMISSLIAQDSSSRVKTLCLHRSSPARTEPASPSQRPWSALRHSSGRPAGRPRSEGRRRSAEGGGLPRIKSNHFWQHARCSGVHPSTFVPFCFSSWHNAVQVASWSRAHARRLIPRQAPRHTLPGPALRCITQEFRDFHCSPSPLLQSPDVLTHVVERVELML